MRLILGGDAMLGRLREALAGVDGAHVEPAPPSLEDVFVAATHGRKATEHAP